MSSLMQEKAINELVANGGTIAHAMRKAGYSPKTARTPKKLTTTKHYQKIVKPLVDQLEAERQAIMKRLPKVRNKAKYRDLMDGLDKVTKTHQLLTGGATENLAVGGVNINVRKDS